MSPVGNHMASVKTQKINLDNAAAVYAAAIASGKKKPGYTACQNNVAVWINSGWDRNDPVMHCYACRADGSYWQPLVFLNGSTDFVGNGRGDDFTFLAPNWGDIKKGTHKVTVAGRAVSYTAQSRCAVIHVTNAKLHGKSIILLTK